MADDAHPGPDCEPRDLHSESERLKQSAAEAIAQAAEGAQLDPEFEKRLQTVESKALEHKRKRETVAAQESKRMASDSESTRGLGVGMTVAYAILGMPLLGAAVGWLIDQRIGTSLWQGIFMLLGAVAGIAFTVITIQKNDKSG